MVPISSILAIFPLIDRRTIEDNDKAKPAERRLRKATGPRFLRDAVCDATKDPKTAGLPIS